MPLLRMLASLLLALFALAAAAAVPDSVVLQGTLRGSDGAPLTGVRAWGLIFYDAPTGGASLAPALTGSAAVSSVGRWSITFVPPAAVLNASGPVWYELAIDSAATPDGGLQPGDVFPTRVLVESVMFAQRARNADLLAGADPSDYVLESEQASALASYATTSSLAAALALKADASHSHALQSLSGAVTDAQVPDTITVLHAASADTASTAAVALSLNGFSASDYATSAALVAGLAGKAPAVHLHDDRYYTESEIDAFMALQSANANDLATSASLLALGLQGLDAAVAGKADANHNHTLSNLLGAVTDAQVPDNITIIEADTLDSIATRGNATTQTLTAGALASTGNVHLPAAGSVYLGDATADGSWRIRINASGNLSFEARVSGAWSPAAVMIKP